MNVTATSMGLKPSAYLNGHTIFPYAVAFMSNATRTALRARILDVSRGLSGLSALTKVVAHGVSTRRFCPECVVLDLATYGETFWHRSHHLPGVLICNLHACILHCTYVPLNGENTFTGRSPPPIPVAPVATKPSEQILTRIASISCRALEGAFEPNTESYRAEAKALGYTLTSTDFASAVLTRNFEEFFGPKFLADAGCPIRGKPNCHWPGLMLRQNTGLSFATPKHILMQAFLGQSSAADVDHSAWYPAPGPKPPDVLARDKEIVGLLTQIAAQVEAIGGRISAKDMLIQAGVWQSFRHNRPAYPLTGKFIEEFRKGEQSLRQTGGRAKWRLRFPKRFGALSKPP